MADTTGAVLVAEIGSLTTRVTLVDVVEGESRMIGRAETMSSVEPPYRNALFGVLEATAQIAEMTGRQLLRDGQLLMPQTSERDGVNHLVAISSAAGNLTLIITAIAADVSARSALHAARCTYTAVLQVVTLDDAARQPTSDDRSWIERQVQSLMALQPDAALIAGGLEGGAIDAVCRLAHIVALTTLHPVVDASGQPRPEVVVRPVLYAGNSAARERVMETLSGRAALFVVDNVRPSLTEERLEPARLELQRIYDEQVMARMPGIAALRRLSRVPVTTVCNATGLMTRFLAERHERHVLTVDVGAASSSAFLAGPGAYNLAVLGSCGGGYGLTTVLTERGPARIARWLPFPMAESDLIHWMLNKLLRPQQAPASREDLLIEHAIIREALALTLTTLADERPALEYDLVVAGGGVLAHAPHPAVATLTLLDALQEATGAQLQQTEPRPLLDLHLDTLGLMPACGALAALDPDAAVTLCDRDLMRNTPLATCVVALGDGRLGELALEAELIVLGGHTQRVQVRHGQIVRLPLDPGSRGQLILRPASGVWIGGNQPGVEVSSNPAEIGGSALGVVIDARGRPLRLAEDEHQRCIQHWEWLVALGAERGQNPYVAAVAELTNRLSDVAVTVSGPLNGSAHPESTAGTAEPGKAKPGARISLSDLPPEAPPAETGKAKPGARISLSDLPPEAPPAETGKAKPLARLGAKKAPEAPPAPEAPHPATDSLQSDLDKLRQTVEAPQKRGWFGRKK